MIRPRFTIRWLMIAVAVVGIILGGGYRMYRLRQYYLWLAKVHGDAAYPSPKNYPGGRKPVATPQELRRETEALEREDDLHLTLQAKYERAARYPWLPVAIDPPEPK